MKLPTVLAILWARRAIFAIPVAGALIGSSIAMAVSPTQYQASARVVLNYIKPEPETGLFVTSKMADSYEMTQIDVVRGPEVAALAAESMGWLDSPEMQEAYALRDVRDTRDMRSWIAGRLASGISAIMVEDSNILEIRYVATTPQLAQTVVSAIRDAYIEASTDQFRRSADERADANAARLEEVGKSLAELESRKTRFERATGLLLDDRSRDFDSMQLGRVVAATRAPKPVVAAPLTKRESATLAAAAAADSAVASGAQGLGPNHPQYQALLRQREQLKIAAQSLSGRDNSVSDFFVQRERAQAALFDSLKAKVLSQRDRVLELRLLQDQIDQQRALAKELSQNIAEGRQLSVGEQTGLVATGDPSEARRSIRSNDPLIIATATGMGVLYGALLSLLVEFLARQVRSVETLQVAAGAPVIGVVPRGRHQPERRPRKARGKGLAWLGRRAPVQA